VVGEPSPCQTGQHVRLRLSQQVYCYNVLRPQRCTLINSWDFDEYRFILEDAPQMRDLRSAYSTYSGLDPKEALAAAFESSTGARQNIGVIPAFLTFSKRYEIHSVTLTAGEWSDFYFSNQPDSDLVSLLKAGLINLLLVELPNESLGGYHHKLHALPEGRARLVPSFLFRRN
jgi:hypothetical protein